jgi:hypothetical protein
VGDATVKKITPNEVVVGAQTIQLPDIVGFAQSNSSDASSNTRQEAADPSGARPSGLQDTLENGPPGASSLVDSVLNGIKN